jgi:hypothetical protein
MYGKIFESMYDGSLYGQWEAIVTFQQMIVIADKYGVVDMTPQALAGKTSIPLEIIEKGIELLSQPDEMSRTPDEGGVRIILLDEHRPWGWEIVNYAKYCEIAKYEDRRNQNRINQRNKREREKADDQDTAPAEPERAESKPERKPKPKRFAEFWEAYPKCRNEKGCEQIWVSKNLDEIAERIIAAVNASKANDPEWSRDEGRWIPSSERYLNESRWEDAISTKIKHPGELGQLNPEILY